MPIKNQTLTKAEAFCLEFLIEPNTLDWYLGELHGMEKSRGTQMGKRIKGLVAMTEKLG